MYAGSDSDPVYNLLDPYAAMLCCAFVHCGYIYYSNTCLLQLYYAATVMLVICCSSIPVCI